MKITKSYLKQLIMEELGAVSETEQAERPTTYLDLYKEMGQALRDGASEEEIAEIIGDMIALHPDQKEIILRRASAQRNIVGALKAGKK